MTLTTVAPVLLMLVSVHQLFTRSMTILKLSSKVFMVKMRI